MTTVNIPQRLKDIIKKQVYIDYTKILKEIEECFGSCVLHNHKNYISRYSYNDDFNTTLSAYVESHDNDCEEYPYGEDDDCDCENKEHIRRVKMCLAINYKDINIYYHYYYVSEPHDNNVIPEWKQPEYYCLRFFEKIPDSIILCKCGKPAEHQMGRCRRCYLDSYSRTDEEGGDCSICLENEGLWHKTHCGHEFHQHCLLKALQENRKCPLCRTPIPNCIHAGGQANPYNV